MQNVPYTKEYIRLGLPAVAERRNSIAATAATPEEWAVLGLQRVGERPTKPPMTESAAEIENV